MKLKISPMVIRIIANEAAKGMDSDRIKELFILYNIPIMQTDDEIHQLMDMILPEYLTARRNLKN